MFAFPIFLLRTFFQYYDNFLLHSHGILNQNFIFETQYLFNSKIYVWEVKFLTRDVSGGVTKLLAE